MKRLLNILFVLLMAGMVLAAKPMPVQYVDLNAQNPQADSALMARIDAEETAIVSLPCTYQSVDQHGENVILSGKIYFPKDAKPKAFVIQTHYTILANEEAPSQCDMPDVFLREKGYALILPDYLGYGISAERNHPYLHCDLAAQNTIDLYLAAHDFLKKLDRLPENDSLILVGYSQGAQSALATLRLIETKYPQIPVKQAFLGSGPYDVARTNDVAMRENKVGLQFTIPLLIMGTSWAYDLNLDPHYFMNEKTVQRAEKYVFSKTYSAGKVVLCGKLGPSKKVSKYMTPEGMDKSLPETRKLYDGLIRSSIVHVGETDTILGDWTPKTPMFILHSYQDKGVTFENALSLKLMLETKGVTNAEYDFGNYGNHLKTMVRFCKILGERL